MLLKETPSLSTCHFVGLLSLAIFKVHCFLLLTFYLLVLDYQKSQQEPSNLMTLGMFEMCNP